MSTQHDKWDVGFLLDTPPLLWIWLFDFDYFLFSISLADYYIEKRENFKIFKDEEEK